MPPRLPALLLVALALAPRAAAAQGPVSGGDHYLCYQASLAKGQAKLPKDASAALQDRFGGPQGFALKKLTTICNPADRDGSGVEHATVHEEGFAIKAQKGGPKFLKSTHVAVDQFAQRALTISGPASLLDVTPTAPGSTPPSPFASDPTSDPLVNRFKCYEAKLAKGSPKFVAPPSPIVTDDFFTAGQAMVVKKVTKLCNPVDEDGETPAAASRQASLVCYAVKVAKHAPKFTKPTVATNGENFGAQVLVAKKPTELCVPATVDPGLADGPPIVATNGTWTWVDFPDSACDDGSPTGIGVNLANSPDVLVYLEGGGACWDFLTCFTLNTAVHGPFGAAQFDAVSTTLSNSILDRQLAGNPFAGWNMVYVPYCTGDLHSGDNVAAYSSGPTTKMYHHAGHANLLAYLRRLGPTVPSVEKMVVAGASAGGYGALFNYDTFRARWSTGELYLVDDSGPPLESRSFDGVTLPQLFTNWNLGETIDPLCGTDCHTDLSKILPALVAAHSADRMALLSSLQDQVIRSFYGLNAADVQTDLQALTADRIHPTATFRDFLISGSTHTMLRAPASISQNSTSLLTWIDQMVTDSPSWVSVEP